MARNTAAQGREFEHSVEHYLGGCDCESTNVKPKHVGWRGYGYTFIRSAASKGAVDLFGIWGGIYGPPRIFVQCKLSNPVIAPAERRALIDLADLADAVPLVSWRQTEEGSRRKRPHFRRLTGYGPKEFEPWEPTQV